jgi:N-acetylmuramoyl-L-alanine amidase
MRTWKLPLLMVTAALCVPATASAAFQHVVAPGESLYAVAAADGLSVDQLAAANGLSADSQLTAGSTLAIPPQTGDAVPTSSASVSTSDTSAPAQTPATSASSGGGYVVQPGDTLSAIAARYGVSVGDLAAANGLDAAGILPAGATLSVSGGSSSSAADVSTSPATSTDSASSAGGAQPTAESVSPSDVGSIAAQNGVSSSLAQAIADQESGFNNSMVSSTGATGVMQIEPGTWNYIQSNLGGPTLAPGSATDNIRGGVELLHSLLNQTGGDPALAAAGYYQGLASVQAHGMYADTQQYVNNVMALRQRFGGQ